MSIFRDSKIINILGYFLWHVVIVMTIQLIWRGRDSQSSDLNSGLASLPLGRTGLRPDHIGETGLETGSDR